MIELPTDAEPVRIIQGDCLDMMPRLPANTFDSIVSDPPYGLGFMGKQWDHGVPGVPFWTEAKRVLKPGAYMLVMGGSRTYHRLACAVEDAGFEIRDCLMWIYGSGFPKHKACLKPAYEPILLCRKPGQKSTPLNIDECRISTADRAEAREGEATQEKLYTEVGGTNFAAKPGKRYKVKRLNPGAAQNATGQYRGAGSRSDETFEGVRAEGRWPANVLHDGSEEVMEAFAVYGEKASGSNCVRSKDGYFGAGDARHGGLGRAGDIQTTYGDSGDSGSAARFFYAAKASKSERGAGNTHPTVKPLALMEWLVTLATPPGGRVLDCFAGSGSTGKAALRVGRSATLIERDASYCEIIRRRVSKEPSLIDAITGNM